MPDYWNIRETNFYVVYDRYESWKHYIHAQHTQKTLFCLTNRMLIFDNDQVQINFKVQLRL